MLVGASSSGKSAVTRALKGVTSNLTGKDYITHGQTTAQIQVRTDKGVVTLTKGSPEDSYTVLDNEHPTQPRKYTKLGGAVPPDVSAFLGVEPKDAINYAGQWDSPYLLRNSAAEVARVLGNLTNVDAVFEASREALRRKNQFATTLRTREGDLASVQASVARFEELEAQTEAIDAAEKALHAAERTQKALLRLQDLLMALRTAQASLKAAESRTAAPLPDLTDPLSLLGRKQRLDMLIHELSTQGAALRKATEGLAESDLLLASTDEEYNALLREAGTCPTCGQDTSHVHL